MEDPVGEFARLEVQDGVGTIRLDRPKMNALDFQVQDEIAALSVEASERDDIAAVVFYGGERVFAAGADIKEMADMTSQEMLARSKRSKDSLVRSQASPSRPCRQSPVSRWVADANSPWRRTYVSLPTTQNSVSRKS